MPKAGQTSRSRRSSQHMLNFSSDLEHSTRRDSKWWRNLSDRSVRRSLVRNVRLHENENTTFSDGSYPCEEVNSQWWKELNENESTILQRNAFANRNTSNSVVEDDDKTVHESQTEENDENVARKMIFTGRQRGSGNHRFSKAFHLEQSQINEPQVQVVTDTHENSGTNDEQNKIAKTDRRTGESSKRKVKRKTVQLFSRKPYSQRFSEAFHSVEENKIESEQPDNEEQHSEIIVPATQESQETARKSQVGLDTLSNIEEHIEVNETFAKNKTNLETITQKRTLFSNIPERKRKFSEAFLKAAVDETYVGGTNEEEPVVTEKAAVNDDTIDTELYQSVEIGKRLFVQKQTQGRKFSEAFSKTNHSDDSVDKSKQELAERASKSVRKSELTINLNEISDDVFLKEQTENTGAVRKSTRISKNNDTNQMEMSENIQIKQNLFQKNTRDTRKFSEAFNDAELSNRQEENNTVAEHSKVTRKSTRISKQINETNQMEMSENVQTKHDLFKAKDKKTRKFSEAFAETKIVEKSFDGKELSDNQGDNTLGVNSKMSERKSTRTSEHNTMDQTHTSDIIEAKKELFRNKIKESRKFSAAFAETPLKEKLDNKTGEYQEMERNKSTDQPNESSHLSTLPSINDTVGVDKKMLFKPKARKSLFSLGNTPRRMKKIDENAAVESEPNPQSSPAESIDQNVVFSDSVTSRFFETSLISSTKLINNPNLTGRNSADDSQVKENQNKKSKTRSTNIVPQEIFITAEQTEKPENANTEIVNKGASKIPVLQTASKKIRKTLDEIEKQSELTNNENVEWNKTATEYEDINAVENSERRTSLKNISERATTALNEDKLEESQMSHSSGKRSSKFITDDIQTHISNNKSSRVSTTAERTDKPAEEKPATRTSSHKNTSTFNLNDVEKNVTYDKSNRISVEQDTGKNATEIQPMPRKSSLKYSKDADRQSIASKSKKESVGKSLQSEYGEKEKSKKSDITKKILRFTENYENEIVNENEERTSHITVSSTDRASTSLQRKPSVVPIKEAKLKSKGDASVNDKKLQMQKELLLKALKEVKSKTSQITEPELPSNKFADFFSKINYNAIPKKTTNKVTKSKPKPIPSILLVNGKRYKPEKLFKGAQWCNKRFYKYLQSKMQDKYGISTIVESENLMKIIVASTKIILKSKQHPADEITKLKKELARQGIISTTFDFYELVENYLPYDIRDKIVPCTRAHYATPTVPYNHGEVYKPIEF